MLTFGYVIDTRSNEMGGREIQVRIPSVHGAFDFLDYGGVTPRNYVRDGELPWYTCIESVSNPSKGEVVVLASTNASGSSFIVIGSTGSTYVPKGVYD